MNEPAFIARGLRAHKNATRKMVAAERQIGIRRDPRSFPLSGENLSCDFSYNGKSRTVEPQTYGLSFSGRELLRAYERPAGRTAKRLGMAKLFDLKRMSGVQETGESFAEALPAHNPQDSAMVEIFATLPLPKNGL